NEERGYKLRRIHYISNVNKVLDFCADRGITLVNIHAPEIVDGNPCIILGLIWSLILRFHIQEFIRLSSTDLSGSTPTLRTKQDKAKQDAERATAKSVRQSLLENLNRRFPINATDFGQFWKKDDGEAFLTLIDAIHPQVKAREKGRAVYTNRARLQLAFDLAEKELGIKRFLDPEDIDVEKPDERSIMTYVSQFLNRTPSSSAIKEPVHVSPTPEPVQQTQQQCYTRDVITNWVEFVMKTGITRINIEQIESEFNQLKNDFERSRNSLSEQTIKNWYLIERELQTAKKMNDWIYFATETMRSYHVPLSGKEVAEQLGQHYLKFSTIPKA
ncbi:Nesprin-1-like protein, partial [Leptotrombidium deliense]